MGFGIFLAVIIVIGLGLLFMMNAKPTTSKKKMGRNTINRQEIRQKWDGIEQTFSLGGPSNFKSAIMEADKLVDYAMINLGLPGNTMGERLKAAKPKFGNYNDYNNLWFAHKVRNNIAHEINHDLNSAEAKRAMEYFKMALKTFGAI